MLEPQPPSARPGEPGGTAAGTDKARLPSSVDEAERLLLGGGGLSEGEAGDPFVGLDLEGGPMSRCGPSSSLQAQVRGKCMEEGGRREEVSASLGG